MRDGFINASGLRAHSPSLYKTMGILCKEGLLYSSLDGKNLESITDVINNQIYAVYDINQCLIDALLAGVQGNLDSIKETIANYTLNKYTFGNPYLNQQMPSNLASLGDTAKPQYDYSNYIVSTSKLTQWYTTTGTGKFGQQFGRGYQGWKVTVTFSDGTTSTSYLEKTMTNVNPPVNLVNQTATDAAITQAIKQYTEGTNWNGTITNVIDVTKVEFPKVEIPVVDLSYLNNL